MNIIHFSAECFPAAKAGGLGDVVGSLPIHQQKAGHEVTVVIPRYHNSWFLHKSAPENFKGRARLGGTDFIFSVYGPYNPETLGFELYAIDIPGRFDRPDIYIDASSGFGFWDEFERFLSFQIAALTWLEYRPQKPDILHCHDHHSALIPFIAQRCYDFQHLGGIPTLLTIHNAEYQGSVDLGKSNLLPAFNPQVKGLLDWEGSLNPLAAGVKCASHISSVSPNYMQTLNTFSNGLEYLFAAERHKSTGILNGIDTELWNPGSDHHLVKNFTQKTVVSGKKENKKSLSEFFRFDENKPLFVFIGRLVWEKGADILPDAIREIAQRNIPVNLLILGTGQPEIQRQLTEAVQAFPDIADLKLEYNEALAHKLYAGGDFLVMPSRIEPCGLNQMFAMRYGTIPVVRNVGGLADTVSDLYEKNGTGILFDEFSIPAFMGAIERAVLCYSDKKLFQSVRKKVLSKDFSWTSSVSRYTECYQSLIHKQKG